MIIVIAAALAAAAPAPTADPHVDHKSQEQHKGHDCCKDMKMDCCKEHGTAQQKPCCAEHEKAKAAHAKH